MVSSINTSPITIVIYMDENDLSKQFYCKNEAESEYNLGEEKSVRATLKDVTYTKKIYEPCLLSCIIQLERSDREKTKTKDVIDFAKSLKGKRVDAFRNDPAHSFAQNHFVYRAVPTHEKDDSIHLNLEIYSMDKLLDMMSYSRSYVARKLRSEILSDAIERCKYGKLKASVADNDELQFMAYDNHKAEFVQPYIVQYNETPYSMLRRTANRCGEFFYFENGCIHMGLPKSDKSDVVGNDKEDKMQFKSVSYSDTVESNFGTDLQYQADSYMEKDKEDYISTLLVLTEGTFSAQLEEIHKSLKDPKVKGTFLSYCDNYSLNAKYRDLYERAKNVVSSVRVFKATIAKEKAALSEICKADKDVPSEEAILRRAPSFMESRQKDLWDTLKKEENKLHSLEGKKKEYEKLEAERLALKQEYQSCPEDDPSRINKKTQYDEKNAELNLFIEKEGSLAEIKAKIETCLANIVAQKKENNKIDNAIIKFKSENSTVEDKLNAIRESQCWSLVEKSIQNKINKRNAKIKEIEESIDNLKKDPDILKEHKTEDHWKEFVEWQEFSAYDEKAEDGSAKAKEKLDKIWKDTFKEGKERYPIDVKASVRKIKEIAGGIKDGSKEYELTEKANKDQVKKNCEKVIEFCEAFLESKEPKAEETPAVASVYHMEYANDEFLETYKKDKYGGFFSSNFANHFFDTCNQDSSAAKIAVAKSTEFFGNLFTSDGFVKTFLAAELAANALNVGIAKLFIDWFNDAYNEKYIDKYQHNGVEVAKNPEYGTSDEVSLFSTYNKDDSRKASVVGLSLAFSSIFYKEIWQQEKRINDQKIIIEIDTTVNTIRPKLGGKIEYESQEYIITSISGRRIKDQDKLINEEIVEAISVLEISKDKKLNIPPLSNYPRYLKAEPQMATVADDDDPSFYARVRVRYRWQGSKDEPTPWIRVSTPFASKGGGILFIPKAKDQVMISYENGNIERPYVSNAVYDANNMAPMPISEKKPTRMMISSPNGHSIKFRDTGAAAMMAGSVSGFDPIVKFTGSHWGKDWGGNPGGGITISDSYGFYNISCSAEKRAISIKSPLGSVGISAFTGINISAPNGDVKITGKNVTIAANNDVKIVSGLRIKRDYDDSKEKMSYPAFLADSIATAAGDKIAEIIDLKLFRHAWERMIPPTSGIMTIKSYRFMLLDSGINDFNVKEIKSNTSTKNKLGTYKGWTKRNGTEGAKSKLIGNIWDIIWSDVMSGVAKAASSLIPEKNNWRVDSDKDVIIMSGNQYITNESKNSLHKLNSMLDVGGDEVEPESLYTLPTNMDEKKKGDDLAGEYKAKPKTTKGEHFVRGVSHTVVGVLGLPITILSIIPSLFNGRHFGVPYKYIFKKVKDGLNKREEVNLEEIIENRNEILEERKKIENAIKNQDLEIENTLISLGNMDPNSGDNTIKEIQND